MDTQPTTGLDLKLARVGARVRQNTLADAMGVSPSRIAAIEREAVVSGGMEQRYRKALDTCRTLRTSAVA